jgi:hypothetical protein
LIRYSINIIQCYGNIWGQAFGSDNPEIRMMGIQIIVVLLYKDIQVNFICSLPYGLVTDLLSVFSDATFYGGQPEIYKGYSRRPCVMADFQFFYTPVVDRTYYGIACGGLAGGPASGRAFGRAVSDILNQLFLTNYYSYRIEFCYRCSLCWPLLNFTCVSFILSLSGSHGSM